MRGARLILPRDLEGGCHTQKSAPHTQERGFTVWHPDQARLILPEVREEGGGEGEGRA